jgi:hypothetical protein
MTELDHRRRPGVAFAGFAVTGFLLIAVVLAYGADAFAGSGWAGGQYASVFVGTTIAAMVAGAGLQAARRSSPWRPFGFGLLLGGGAGVLIIAAAFFALWYAFSNAAL